MASSSDSLDDVRASKEHRPAARRNVEASQPHAKPSERARERFNIANRNTQSVPFDKEAIRKAANDHDCFHFRRYTLRNLPKYDDCTPYVTEPDKIDELFRAEVLKLIKFAELQQPPIFNSHGCLQGVGCKGFEDLSNLADQMLCISDVLTHDNSRHGVIFGRQVAGEAWDGLIRTRDNLRTRYAKDERHVEGGQPVILEDGDQSQRNSRAFHSLLDYILAVITWWLVRCADSEYWRTEVVATLAQWAVKMKVISNDPVRCAEYSLSETFSMIERLKVEAEMNDVLVKIGGKKKDAEAVQTQTNYCNLYCEEKLWIRTALKNILSQVLEAFVQDDKSGIQANLFEVCTMIYRRDTKPDRSGKIWTGLRHGDIGVSSGLEHITFCYNLSKLLELHFNEVQSQVQSKPPKTHSNEFVEVKGHIREGQRNPKLDLKISTMDHAITLLTPLVLMQPRNARQIQDLMNTAMAFMDGKEVLRVFSPPPTDFALEVTLSTSAWLQAQDPRSSEKFDPDVTSLSQSPLRKGLQDAVGARRVKALQLEYTARVTDMLKWDVRTSEIVLYCRTYVRCIQALATTLVLGGLAVPFSVGERITGVDPFQIATYTWLLAGFFLIAAKSFYVDDWPWNDFLHGHVKCHSVSDLSEVSGIDPQIVLLFLLRNEWNNLLVTDGPYNGMFSRTIEKRGRKNREKDKETTVIVRQGFSIDEPLHVYTMLASGIVPLKVRDGHGEHLICIDGRKGGWDMANSGRRLNWMTCPNFASEDLENMYDGNAPGTKERGVHMLERIQFKWARVLGVYVKDCKFG